MVITPQTVSRMLRRAGYGIVTTHLREGLRVTRTVGGGACIHVQFDSPRAEARRVADVAGFLQEQGFKILVGDGACVYVIPQEDAQ